MFPVIPNCGLDRKKSMENVLKKIQELNSSFRYQIRLGEKDFKVFAKYYTKGEYDPYREIPLEFLDPHGEFPEIKTKTVNSIPEEDMDEEETNVDTENWTSLSDRQRKKVFRNKLALKKAKVSILQIAEFLYEFIKGTKVNAHDNFLASCLADLMEMEAVGLNSQ